MKRYLRVILCGSAALSSACGNKDNANNQPAANPAPPPPAVAAVNGQAIFARTCQTCHQANGQGIPNTYPPQAGSPFVNGDKSKLIRIALNGLQGPVTVDGKRYNNVMPPWKSLSDAEMAAVLTYVRSSFGNTGDAVTADEVARERAATASRTTMWTMAELERR